MSTTKLWATREQDGKRMLFECRHAPEKDAAGNYYTIGNYGALLWTEYIGMPGDGLISAFPPDLTAGECRKIMVRWPDLEAVYKVNYAKPLAQMTLAEASAAIDALWRGVQGSGSEHGSDRI